jgi:hypothetical protein
MRDGSYRLTVTAIVITLFISALASFGSSVVDPVQSDARPRVEVGHDVDRRPGDRQEIASASRPGPSGLHGTTWPRNAALLRRPTAVTCRTVRQLRDPSVRDGEISSASREIRGKTSHLAPFVVQGIGQRSPLDVPLLLQRLKAGVRLVQLVTDRLLPP